MENEIIAAPVENVEGVALAGTKSVGDMSFLDLFLHADIVVQLVILGLIAASVVSWSIFFQKASQLRMVKFKTQRFESNFWSGTSLDQLYEKQKGRAGHPMAQIFVAAMGEVAKTKATSTSDFKQGLLERLQRVMQTAKNRAIDDLEHKLSFLATVGSTSPFVGLFGTVWGIMNSFTSIAAAKNISLAIVAPGIAEALFATAIGLVVAIPAVIFYNKFVKDINVIANRADDFGDEFLTLISRQLDEGKI